MLEPAGMPKCSRKKIGGASGGNVTFGPGRDFQILTILAQKIFENSKFFFLKFTLTLCLTYAYKVNFFPAQPLSHNSDFCLIGENHLFWS